jgi:8-oxo-dGTP diphosphatase
MKLLATIRQQDFQPDVPAVDRAGFYHRKAARAVVSDANGAVALLHVSQHGYYKLPGGGLEDGEDMALALERELKEEIGCVAEITAELGEIVEHRDYWEMVQTSYCFTATVVGAKGLPELTEEELQDGFEVMWAKDLQAALALAESVQSDDIGILFMQRRDVMFLRAALALQN